MLLRKRVSMGQHVEIEGAQGRSRVLRVHQGFKGFRHLLLAAPCSSLLQRWRQGRAEATSWDETTVP